MTIEEERFCYKSSGESAMKYTFTNKNMTIEEANLLLRVLWGTCDDEYPSRLPRSVYERPD